MNLQNLAALILIASILTLMAHRPPAAPSCRSEPPTRPIWDMRRLNANLEF